MKVKMYLPKKDACLWLDCLSKGYNQFAGYCSTHYQRGLKLGDNKQCFFYDKKGSYCLTETKEKFNERYYCLEHKKLLIEYEKEHKEILKELEKEKEKKTDNKKKCKHGKNTK